MERNQNPFTGLGKKFREELEGIVKTILAKKGIKNSSDLADSVEFSDNSRDSLFLYVNEYYAEVSRGRKPRAKKIPISSLIRFIKRNNISNPKMSTTQIAFAMQNSIYKNGITGKNFIDQIERSVLDTVENRCADYVEEFIADSLYSAFVIK